MARPSKPYWCVFGKNRPARWRTTIDGRAYYAPVEIGKAQEAKAWEWFAALKKSLEPSTAQHKPTCYWLCVAYLQWADAQAQAGKITREHYGVQRAHLALWLAFPGVRDQVAAELSVDLVQRFVDDLATRYSAHHVANVGRTLRAVWRWGARPVAARDPNRLIAANPLDGYAFPRASQATKGYVESAHVRRFLRWAWARARAETGLKRRFDRLFLLWVQFQRLTGVRPGEACRLRWSDWDREAGTIVWARHKTSHRGKRRAIYVTPPVARLLRTIERLEGRHDEFVFTHMRARGADARGHYFPLAGEPWPSGSAAASKVRTLREAAIAAGVEGVEATGERRLTAYCARHGYASEAIDRGLTIEQTAELLGNSPQVTAQVYAHTVETGARARAEAIALRGFGKRPVDQRGNA